MKYTKHTKTMLYKTKLRGSFGRYYPIAVLLCYIFCVVEFLIRQNLKGQNFDIPLLPHYSITALAVFFIVLGIVQFIRYKLWAHLILGILFGINSFLSIGHYLSPYLSLQMYLIGVLIVILFVLINWRTFYSQEKFETNARRLFRLSAELLTEISDGFTERPFTAGNVTVSSDELLGFARFIEGKYVARVFYLEHAVYLALSMNKSVLKISHPNEVSYVSISKHGAVTVRISAEDYRQYKATLNFDQLCNSLANTFKRFIEYYQNGNEYRIIAELKTAR